MSTSILKILESTYNLYDFSFFTLIDNFFLNEPKELVIQKAIQEFVSLLYHNRNGNEKEGSKVRKRT